jgi:hypothetical protein
MVAVRATLHLPLATSPARPVPIATPNLHHPHVRYPAQSSEGKSAVVEGRVSMANVPTVHQSRRSMDSLESFAETPASSEMTYASPLHALLAITASNAINSVQA